MLHRDLVALGLFQAWLFALYHSPSVVPEVGQTYTIMYTLSIAGAIAALVLSLVFPYKKVFRRRFVVGSAVVGAVCTAFVRLLSLGGVALGAVSFALGLAIGVFVPFIGKAYCKIDLSTATRRTFLAFGLGALVYFVILGIPAVARIFVIALLPAGIAYALIALPGADERADVRRDQHIEALSKSRSLVGFFVGTASIGFAFGFCMAFCGVEDAEYRNANMWSVLLVAAVAAVYLLIIRKTNVAFDFERFFAPVVPTVMLGLLVFDQDLLAASILIIVGFQLSDIVIWIVCSWVGSHTGLLSHRVFCVSKACSYGGMLVGAGLLNLAWSLSFDAETLGVITRLGAFVVVIATVFVFNNSAVNFAIKSASKQSDFVNATHAVELRCSEIGDEYLLTAREREVLKYLVQGRSLPYIEQKLCISHGTANSHRDHIYTKLGVHSKQEIIDLFFGSS